MGTVNRRDFVQNNAGASLPVDGLKGAERLKGVDVAAAVKTLVPLGAEVDGRRYGEYDASPFRGRVLAEARVFF